MVPVRKLGELMHKIKAKGGMGWQIMYEVIREMKEGRINGCLYTDGWPHFSTAVTQEFTPKLSEVGDLRFATNNIENLVELILQYNLISWTRPQLIYYINCNSMDINTDEILSRLKFYSPKDTQGRFIDFSLLFNSNLISSQQWHLEVQRQSECLSQGLVIGNLQPHHAAFVSQFWFQEYTQSLCEAFLYNNIYHYKSTAIFDIKQPHYPVAWSVFKAGGMVGIRYSLPLYRRRRLSNAIHLMNLWKAVLYNNPGYSEIDDDLLNLYKIEQKNIVGKSMCIWNYPSLQKFSSIN